jgi:hypothetical protein
MMRIGADRVFVARAIAAARATLDLAIEERGHGADQPASVIE